MHYSAQFLSKLRVIYLLLLLLCLGLLCFFIYRGEWLQTELQALLPKEQQWQALQQQVNQKQQQQLNSKIIALIQAEPTEQAFQLSQQIAKQWRDSGLFANVNSQFQPDLAQLQQQVKMLSFATLPSSIQVQLEQNPQHYFQQYAEQLSNPFNGQNILPLAQDWLGFARFTLAQAQPQTHIQWQPNNGMLTVTQQNQTWVLLQADLTPQNALTPPTALFQLIQQNQQYLQQQHAKMLITGASLFALQAKQTAEQESQWMSVLGISLTLILLLLVFRTFKVLWLFLPIFAGMLVGVVATILCFGQVHILTLVIGTSLVGVLIDFPLHWLAGALVSRQWQANNAMRKLRLTFTISLLITLLGYGLLGFTTLPVLQQTALFSAVALLSAMACTQLCLPCFFRHYTVKRPQRLLLCFYKTRTFFIRLFPTKKVFLFGLSLFAITGIYQAKWQDDIRQWVVLSPDLLNQAQKIAELTGIQLSGQYFLVLADDDETLLQRLSALDKQLAKAQQQHQLKSYRSLSQWLMSETQQRQLAQHLQQLTTEDYSALIKLGIPATILQKYINELQQQPTVSLQQALNSSLGKAWQPLYLGKIDQQNAAIVNIDGGDHQALSQLANHQNIFWLDQRSHLNDTFQQTRDQAVWLKLLSFVLAGLLLYRYFGTKISGKMLSIPVCAVLLTLALFGWLGLPISLFAMFGMLLVSAIAIDYTAYLQSVSGLLAHKQLAVLLAATTTMISFLLLTFSTTPAVALFGLSVSCGVLWAVVLAFNLYHK